MRRFISLNRQVFQGINDIKGQLLEHDMAVGLALIFIPWDKVIKYLQK